MFYSLSPKFKSTCSCAEFSKCLFDYADDIFGKIKYRNINKNDKQLEFLNVTQFEKLKGTIKTK